MSNVYNVAWYISKTKWVVNFNSQNNLDFAGPSTDADMRFRDALQQAYYREIELAQAEVGLSRFYRNATITWPASQVTLTLDTSLHDKQFIEWRDITSSSDGEPMLVGSRFEDNEIWELSGNTFQWGTAGAPRATTIQATYLAEAEELLEDNQVPALIPRKYAWLLVYSAAEILYGVADPSVPGFISKEINRLRDAYHKSLSRGRFLHSDAPVIRNDDV